MTLDAAPRNSLAAESLLFAGWLLTQWRRESLMLIQALVYPIFLLLTYKFLVGKSIMRITGTDSLYGLVPMCAVAGAMFGALAAGRSIRRERLYGLISRFWVMPVNRASALTGRLLAEAARTLVSTALITAVGIGIGLRFEGGWLAVIPFTLAPVPIIVVFSMAVTAITMRFDSSIPLILLGVPSIGSVFACSGVPPIATLPASARLLIQLQPMWSTIEFMRALAQGGPVLWPLLGSIGWAVGLAAVLGPLAVRAYRAAAESGH